MGRYHTTSAQSHLELGWNVGSLFIGTLDLKSELGVSPGINLRLGMGLRAQSYPIEQVAQNRIFAFYRQPRNLGSFISVGFRAWNPTDNPYQYPYLALDVVGIHYRETLLVRPNGQTPAHPSNIRGWTAGISATLGFVLRLARKWHMDAGIQLGYAPPREELLSYYHPGIGFSTFGSGIIGIKGGHIQPILALRYTLQTAHTQRIREME
ncbi:DUF3575 domain-containing protein [Pontibacter sp. G13]|uniref:DUF3575 domain-containing protein n=1 Tax=Pontibacter sp. G13 TaxID=3074898 RepID=UPI003906A303